MPNVNFELTEDERTLLKTICVLRGEKQKDTLREVVLEWIQKNRHIINDNPGEFDENIIDNFARKIKNKKNKVD